jgi:hypothetical protein
MQKWMQLSNPSIAIDCTGVCITADSGLLASPLHVMAGLVPAIHVFLCRRAPESKTWMPATSAGMTTERLTQFERKSL